MEKNLYFPKHLKKNIVLQQDGFLNKALKNISELEQVEHPINQH